MAITLPLNDLVLAWLAYAAGVALLLFICWRLTGAIGARGLRDLIRAMTVVLLVVPAQVPAYPGVYAPAWVVALSEAVLQEHGNPLPAIALLLSGAVALSLAMFLFRWRGAGQRR